MRSSCSPSCRSGSTTPTRSLSGGEQQMVVLAQALVSKPRFVIIDELSLGLAPVVVQRLIPTIRDGRRVRGRGAADRAVRHGRARPGQPRLRHGGRADPVLGQRQGAARDPSCCTRPTCCARSPATRCRRRPRACPPADEHRCVRAGARARALRTTSSARASSTRARSGLRTGDRPPLAVRRLLAVRRRRAVPAHRRPRRLPRARAPARPDRRRARRRAPARSTTSPSARPTTTRVSARLAAPGSSRCATPSPAAARASCSSRTRTGCGSRSTSEQGGRDGGLQTQTRQPPGGAPRPRSAPTTSAACCARRRCSTPARTSSRAGSTAAGAARDRGRGDPRRSSRCSATSGCSRPPTASFAAPSWHMDFIYQLGGIEKAPGDIKVQFRNADGTVEWTPAAIARQREGAPGPHDLRARTSGSCRAIAGEGVDPEADDPVAQHGPLPQRPRRAGPGRVPGHRAVLGRPARRPTPTQIARASPRSAARTSSSTTPAWPTSTTRPSASRPGRARARTPRTCTRPTCATSTTRSPAGPRA